MIRKIIKQANQAYTITLPISWVRENNIDNNREIELEIQDKSIIIKNTKEISLKKEEIKFNTKNRLLIKKKIQALYAKGIDEIKINSSKDIEKIIIDILKSVIGYALVKSSDKEYIIKEISGGNYSELDDIFKRVFQIVLSFYDSAIKDIFGKEIETMEGLNNRDREVNKFCLFLERAINKMSYSDQIKGRIMFTYSFSLEKIGDEIHRLWRTNIHKKFKKSTQLKEILDLSKKGLELSFNFHYGVNSDIEEEIHRIKEKVRKDALKFKKTEEIEFVRHAIKIVEDAADLLHLSLMNKK